MSEKKRRPPVLIGLAVVGAAVVIGLGAWVWISPPIAGGSPVAVMGENAGDCGPTSSGWGVATTCTRVPFAEGGDVGIGFAVRNAAPVAMTVVDAYPLESSDGMPADLHPEQLEENDFTFGLDSGRRLSPIEVGPGEEIGLQLVGTYRSCTDAARSSPPGTAVVIDRVGLTVRWAFVETDLELPLQAALLMPAPASCPAG